MVGILGRIKKTNNVQKVNLNVYLQHKNHQKLLLRLTDIKYKFHVRLGAPESAEPTKLNNLSRPDICP